MRLVKIIDAPISDRYWKKGDIGFIGGRHIKVKGCWFDFDDRWKIEEIEPCPDYIGDGAGHYCKLIDMRKNEDYPHSYWRVMCHGDREHPCCEACKRELINKK